MDYLNSRLMFGMVPGLTSTRKLCDALGNPQKKFRSIHVVGTNGKGSTSFYLSGILKSHGLKTGLFTSPHLVSLRERIRVDDRPIEEKRLEEYLLRVQAAAKSVSVEPTFFEVLTLVAFLYYADEQVDVAVLEAGMGGRLDSTAVACGEIAVVTSIGLEHTEVLGQTEELILKEKMGVKGKIFVVGGLSQKLLEVARSYAQSLGADFCVPEIREEIKLSNLGRHYVENASLSLKAAQIFLENNAQSIKISYDDNLAVCCLENRSWAGRMQLLKSKTGEVRFILDGAHNSHAVSRLVESLERYYPNQKFHCVFGALKDKDVSEMLKLMAPHVCAWHITKTPYPRFRELDDLESLLHGLNLEVASKGTLSQTFLEQVCSSSENAPVLITGSLYMIGECVELLKNDFGELVFFRDLTPSTNEHR